MYLHELPTPSRGRVKYHDRWMAEAQRFYDLLAAGKVNPDGSLKTPQPRKEPTNVLTIKYFADFITGCLGPVSRT